MLLVEHDVEMVQAFTTRLSVLDFGTLIAEGPTAEVMQRRRGAHGLPRRDRRRRTSSPRRSVAARRRPRRPRRRAGPDGGAPVLELRDVDAGYGPFRALFGVSFSIPEGQVVALLGANGAGKTTIARVVSGLVPVTAGAVRFDGVDITGMKPWDIAPLGIVQAPEGRSVFGTLTVEENLTLDFRRSLGRQGRRRRARARVRAVPAARRAAQAARRQPLRRRAADARRSRGCSCGRRGCSSSTSCRSDCRRSRSTTVYATLDQVRREGTTLLLIEQYVGHALRIADSAVLLQHGEVVFDGPAAELGDPAERLLPGRARSET